VEHLLRSLACGVKLCREDSDLDLTWGLILTTAIQVITAAFVYGRLTERVKTLGDRTIDHGRRITNQENITSGPGGHGERITSLEVSREERRREP
jgi:hypothetical protein